MSGTSSAAPYVSGVSGGIKDINPDLSPSEIKSLIMGTVDVDSELKMKVVSSGIVNKARAFKAAELSKAMSLNEAISLAKKEISTKVRFSQYSASQYDIFEEDFFVLPLRPLANPKF